MRERININAFSLPHLCLACLLCCVAWQDHMGISFRCWRKYRGWVGCYFLFDAVAVNYDGDSIFGQQKISPDEIKKLLSCSGVFDLIWGTKHIEKICFRGSGGKSTSKLNQEIIFASHVPSTHLWTYGA